MHTTEVFTELDIIPAEPPKRFVKPWFARGWVIGLVISSIATVWVAYGYYFLWNFSNLWILAVIVCWFITIRKYFFGIRRVEMYPGIVWIYARDPVKPFREIPFESMTVINEVSEIFIIRKGKFFKGIYLKRVYWGKGWDDMRDQYNSRASFVRYQLIKDNGKYQPAFPEQVVSFRRDPPDMFSGFLILFDMIMGIVLWPLHKISSKKLSLR